MEEQIVCTHCGAVIEYVDDAVSVGNEVLCPDCVDDHCCTCDHCNAVIFDSDSYGDENDTLCQHCYENYYTRCTECDRLLHNDDAFERDGYDYCAECYNERCSSIKDYSYKPDPIFYGEGKRFYGVELEIDDGGRDDDSAEELLEIANNKDQHIYIKSDGSLDDGMEIVSHPMSLAYHQNFCWQEIMRKAVTLGYRSHQTSTCGLHIHVKRSAFGMNQAEQEEVIAKILYFVEAHWNELYCFSRRKESNMNRWATRYGFEKTGKEILDKAKTSCYGRYTAVNLCNYHTIEFRLFRGTLKYNTLIAALQLIDEICNAALLMSQNELEQQSWTEFVKNIKHSELIRYLKERQLYVNDAVPDEEDM